MVQEILLSKVLCVNCVRTFDVTILLSIAVYLKPYITKKIRNLFDYFIVVVGGTVVVVVVGTVVVVVGVTFVGVSLVVL